MIEASVVEPIEELGFLLRLGEMLLRSGASSVDVEASVFACCLALGLPDSEVSITYTEVQVAITPPGGGRPLTAMRVVRVRTPDHTRLARAHRIVGDLTEGRISGREAARRLEAAASAAPAYPPWVITASWASLATAVAIQLGGGLVLATITFAVTVILDLIGRWLTARRVPAFYINYLGGALVTGAAAVLVAVDAPVRPPLVIAAGIIVLLPSLVLITAVQDALTGFMVTSAGRAVEAAILIVGIASGVTSGLVVAREAGVTMPVQGRLMLDLAGAPALFVSAGVVAATIAVGLQAPVGLLLPAFVLGGAGYLAMLGLEESLDSPTLTRALVAAGLGLLGQRYCLRRNYPALVLAVPLITPMLPGLAFYSAMLELTQGDSGRGVASLLDVAAQALALAAGVIGGQFLGQPRPRESEHELDRYSGPRLLGPVAVRYRRVRLPPDLLPPRWRRRADDRFGD